MGTQEQICMNCGLFNFNCSCDTMVEKEKLKALVEKWRGSSRTHMDDRLFVDASKEHCADELEQLLR